MYNYTVEPLYVPSGEETIAGDFYLPKAAIDRSSIRMAELLKSRGLYRATKPNNSEDAE